jgi:hypothetical protein
MEMELVVLVIIALLMVWVIRSGKQHNRPPLIKEVNGGTPWVVKYNPHAVMRETSDDRCIPTTKPRSERRVGTQSQEKWKIKL